MKLWILAHIYLKIKKKKSPSFIETGNENLWADFGPNFFYCEFLLEGIIKFLLLKSGAISVPLDLSKKKNSGLIRSRFSFEVTIWLLVHIGITFLHRSI